MSWTRGILLVLLAAALGLYVWRVELPHEEQEAKQAKPLSGWEKADIQKIAIKRKSDAVTLVNDKPGVKLDAGPQWSLEGIQGADADTGSINTLLGGLIAFSAKNPLPKEDLASDLSIYGLSQPEISLVADGPNQITFEFGKKSDNLGQRYVRVSGLLEPAIYLQSEELFRAADKAPKAWRNTIPIDIADGSVRRITFQGPDGKVVLEASEQVAEQASVTVSRWKVIEPYAAEGNDDVVSDILRQLRNLKAKEFYDGQSIGTAEAVWRFEFGPDSKKDPVEIQIARRSTDDVGAVFTLSSKPTLYGVEQDPLPTLLKTPVEFRENKLFRIATARVEGLELTRKGQPALTFEKKDTDWKLNGAAAKYAEVSNLLDALYGLKASFFPSDLPADAFADPTLKVQVRVAAPDAKGAPGTVAFTVGKEAGFTPDGKVAGYFARVGDGTAFAIDVETLAKISVEQGSFIEQPTPTPAPAPSPSVANP